MPERWESELKRLQRVEPSPGLWDRAQRGPSRPGMPAGPSRGGRTLAVVVSVLVVAAAGFGAWRAFGPAGAGEPAAHGNGPASGPSTGPSGYFVTLDDIAAAKDEHDDRTQLTVEVNAQTNLPDGTIAFASWQLSDGSGGTSLSAVEGGWISVSYFTWNVCDFATGFSVKVEVRPFYEDYVVPGYPQNSPWPPAQPDGVIQVLGDHFQFMPGDQVTTADSSLGPIQQIIVEKSYDWPPFPPTFTPPPCPSPPPTPTPSP